MKSTAFLKRQLEAISTFQPFYSQKLSNFFTCWKKLPKSEKKKFAPALPALNKLLFFGTQREKSFLWGTKENKKETFFDPWRIFSLGPPKEALFPFGYQRKTICSRGVGQCKIFFWFWQFFSTCEKITQFLRFCKNQGGPN